MTNSNPNCVAIFSGGLDSTTLVYYLLKEGYTPHLVSFNYGQRHIKELDYAKITAKNLRLRHDIIDLSRITHLISNSALTAKEHVDHAFLPMIKDPNKCFKCLEPKEEHFSPYRDIEVPDGHYAEETMKLTVVPNRNMIMLSIAAGIVVSNKYGFVATGVHAGDHFIYPDCRPAFINAMREALVIANDGFHNFTEDPELGVPDPIVAPFINGSKADIAYQAIELHVPFHLTWSCYKGSFTHCGRCGTCVERLEAIDEATRKYESLPDDEGNQRVAFDLTEYEDTEYWKQAVREAKASGHQ